MENQGQGNVSRHEFNTLSERITDTHSFIKGTIKYTSITISYV